MTKREKDALARFKGRNAKLRARERPNRKLTDPTPPVQLEALLAELRAEGEKSLEALATKLLEHAGALAPLLI